MMILPIYNRHKKLYENKKRNISFFIQFWIHWKQYILPESVYVSIRKTFARKTKAKLSLSHRIINNRVCYAGVHTIFYNCRLCTWFELNVNQFGGIILRGSDEGPPYVCYVFSFIISRRRSSYLIT